MEKMTIVVGTASEQKIGYLKAVLEELGIKAQIVPVAAKSGVSEQPITSAETKRGSVNRAKEALKHASQADLALGIEVGYQKDRAGRHAIHCWVTAIDRDGHTFSVQSHNFLLPLYHHKILVSGKNLGEHLDNFKKMDHPLFEHMDKVIRSREPFIYGALHDVLLRTLLKHEF